ncbi:hypothetical protein SprV_0802480800 [Sparganum proliferum]
MVERFHHQLKASQRAVTDSENCTDHLSLVLLGIRPALKPDLDCPASELVFDTPVRLPAEIISTTPRVAVEDLTNLLHRRRQFLQTLSPLSPRPSVSESPCRLADLCSKMQRNWGPASRENKRKQTEQRTTEFVYDPEGGGNFEAWFRKYEGLFEEEGAELDDKTKVEIMLLKLAQREHERMHTWEDIGSPELRPSEIIAWASNETRMEFEGVFQATVSFRNMTCLADVYVSKTRNNLLGNKTITELGLWNRPFDEICSAVHSTTEEILTNVPGTIAYLDDILVVGSSEEELTQRLDQVVDNLIDYGLKINMEKSKFLRGEIHYLGFIVNENGRTPDPERVKAFQNMKVPKNTKELQSFMGLVSYYGPFITGLHSLKPPLSRLLCKDVEFVWSPECQKAFDAIKTKICDSTMLSHFEADKETIVQADAADYGLGGVLLQKDADGESSQSCMPPGH